MTFGSNRQLTSYWLILCLIFMLHLPANGQLVDLSTVIEQVQPKMVKINGSGGFSGLESYQSAFLISADGHILTVWSYVLDSDVITATLDDGQKFEAELIGYDPRIEIAVLKIDATDLPFFNIDEAATSFTGAKILTFSNLFGVATGNEPTSVLHGTVTARTRLSARSGATASNYQGEVYVVDAMTNNPGSAGGAVTNRMGQLVGLIGKELRDSQTNTWLNFAIPIGELAGSVHDIRAGKMTVISSTNRRKPNEPISAKLLGFVLVSNVIAKTPPFIEQVVRGSAFDRAGIQTDDLIVEIDGRMTPSCDDVNYILSLIDRDAAVSFTVQRGTKFHTIEVQLIE